MVAKGKKLHHYIPRFYLRAWDKKEQIYCLQNGRIFASNIRNVGSENYFYSLQKLTPDDIAMIRRLFIESSDERTKNALNELIRLFTLPHELEQQSLQTGLAAEEINKLIIEMNENLHTNLEDQFKPYLSAMRQGDLTFLNDEKKSAAFFHTLTAQFSRTNNLHRFRAVTDEKNFEMFRRQINLLMHIVSVLTGRSLYEDRNRLNFILIDNKSEVPFITSDQPIINITVNPREFVTPKGFELYYPVTPQRALLMLEPESVFLPSNSDITSDEARILNLRLASHAHQQIFAALPAELEEIRDQLAAYLSCFPPGPSEF
jgi:hypothetical protein